MNGIPFVSRSHWSRNRNGDKTINTKGPYLDHKQRLIIEAMDQGVTASVIARHHGWSLDSIKAIMDAEKYERLAATVTLGIRVLILESLKHHWGDVEEVAKDVRRPVDLVEAIRLKFWVRQGPGITPSISKTPTRKPAKPAMNAKTQALLRETQAIANEVIAKQLSIDLESANMVRAVLWSRPRSNVKHG